MERKTGGGVRVKYGLRSGSDSGSSASGPAPEAGEGSHHPSRYGLFGQSSNSTDHVVLPALPKRKAENAELTSGASMQRFLLVSAPGPGGGEGA